MTFPDYDFLSSTLACPQSQSPSTFTFSSGQAFIEDAGILRLEPKVPTNISLVLSVGVHGNETGPIELVNQLVNDILQGRYPLAVRLLVLFGNPLAAIAQQRFCQVNMNRLFSGAWQEYDGYEAERAQRLEQAVTDFFQSGKRLGHELLHYDLHTAIRGSKHEKFAVYPYLEGGVYSRQQLAFLAASGIDAVLLSHQPTTTFSYYSAQHHGAHAFTVELGKVYGFGQNDLKRFAAIAQSLADLITNSQLPQGELSKLLIFSVQEALIKDAEDYQLHISTELENFTPFEKGYLLAESSKSRYLIESTGDALIFPNATVPIGQRTGLVVRPKSLEQISLD